MRGEKQMSWEYSENILVQNSAGNVLKDKLGWDVEFAYNTEKLGENGTFGRKDYHEIVLVRYLKQALAKFNDWMTDEYANDAIKTLLTYSSTEGLMEINERNYFMLRDGIPVSVRLDNGQVEKRKARVFDFIEPTNNHFLAIKELKIHGDLYRRRTDIVGFVNGIPLLFVELKKQNVDVKVAYDCNYTDYLSTIPQLFRFNAFLMLSNGVEAKVGTMGSPFDFFHEWKRLNEDEVGAVDLETMLLGICKKENFLDLFENFILFDKSGGRTAKILARNHQYLGVNEAVDAYKARKLKDGKLGVFWHTQGSGKSYSMVFLAQKIKRKFEGSPTFIVLTDRDELNKQISGTFEACGLLAGVDASKYIPKSGERLAEMVRSNPAFIFTLIQKFNQSNPVPFVPDYDIIIMSDEAHRSQNGIFADNMCKMLPTASRIGFTGTPLLKYDNITERTFGGYVSIYDFKRAVDDGATVPLYYENRSDMLDIQNPELNEELLDAIEQADLDDDQREKLEREIAKDLHIITAEPRLDKIAKDFVDHYSDIWTTGKAMFVCVNKVTCVRMYNLAQKYWAEKIVQLEKQLPQLTQQEAQELKRKIDWMKQTEMAVIVSQEQNEIAKFSNWGLDILSHREKMEKREMDKEFKDPDNPFRIVFVCAMWLTGFDVKSLATVYLDKPLKAHTLMQTIARANRVYEGKSNGLIVDYIGVVKALRQALADYTENKSGKTVDPAPDKKQLLSKISSTIDSIEEYLFKYEFELKKLVEATDFAKLALVVEGANAVSRTDEIKKKFEIQARELFRMFKYVNHNDLDEEQYKYKNAISAIYDQLQDRVYHADNSALMSQINSIVSKHIYITKTNSNEGNRKFDISKIDFDRLRKEFERAQNKNLLLVDLQVLISQRLAKMLKQNPLRIDYYEYYQQVIDEYNKDNKKDEIAVVFEKLMKLAQDLDEEEKRYVREGFDSDEEMTIFDLLFKDSLSKEDIKAVKKVAVELLEKIKARIKELDHWRDKEETRSIVDILIRDTLWEGMPTCYEDNTLDFYRKAIYEYVYVAYPAA